MRRQLKIQNNSGRQNQNIRIEQNKEFCSAFFANPDSVSDNRMPSLSPRRQQHKAVPPQRRTSDLGRGSSDTMKLKLPSPSAVTNAPSSSRDQRKQFPIAVQQNLDISATDVRLRASQLRAVDLLARLEDDCKERRHFIAQHVRPDPYSDNYDAIANAEQGVLYIPRNLMDEDLTQVRKPGEFDSNYADILTLFLTKDLTTLAVPLRGMEKVGKRPAKTEDNIEDMKLTLRPDDSSPQPPKEERKAMLIAQYQKSMYRLKDPQGK